ncbi:MAG: XRE family transcriptional regulator [Planctomycetota bacterium]|nr:MAG: XRE family transcriptional regulator [Planctomycetota bacterium]
MSFARRLRFLRKDQRLTQSQLATKLGITVDMIRGLENGTRQPSRHIIKLCTEAFGLKTDFFTKDSEDPGLKKTVKGAKRNKEAEKLRRELARTEEEIERRASETSRRIAPADAIGATLRIKKDDDDKEEKEKSEPKKKGKPKDDFDFAGFVASSSEEEPYTDPPELLTTLPLESAGEPPILADVEEEDRVPDGRGELRASAHGKPVAPKKAKKARKAGGPKTLDEMIRELIRRQNALMKLLIEKRVITKQEFRDKLQ